MPLAHATARECQAYKSAGRPSRQGLSYYDMTASAFNNHWRRLAMTGGGTAPKSFEKDEDLRKFVSETPGAIGFVDEASVDASVAKLTVAP